MVWWRHQLASAACHHDDTHAQQSHDHDRIKRKLAARIDLINRHQSHKRETV